MKFIKWYTNRHFNNAEFAEVCREFKVDAVAIDGGVILDVDAYKALGWAHMCHWMWMQWKAIVDNPYHTEPSSVEEFKAAIK